MDRRIVMPAVCDPQSDVSLSTLIDLAIPYAEYTERDARYLIDKVDRIRDAGTWSRRVRGEPKTWERFCSEVLGYDSRYFDEIAEGIKILEGKGVENPTVQEAHEAGLRKNGGDRRSEPFQSCNTRLKSQGQNTGASYYTARLRRDSLPENNPDEEDRQRKAEILDAVMNGTLAPSRAAVMAGYRKEPIILPRVPQDAARTILRHFKPPDVLELVRVLANHAGLTVSGPDPGG